MTRRALTFVGAVVIAAAAMLGVLALLNSWAAWVTGS